MTRAKDVAAVNDLLTRLPTEIARNDFAGDGRYSKNIRELWLELDMSMSAGDALPDDWCNPAAETYPMSSPKEVAYLPVPVRRYLRRVEAQLASAHRRLSEQSESD